MKYQLYIVLTIITLLSIFIIIYVNSRHINWVDVFNLNKLTAEQQEELLQADLSPMITSITSSNLCNTGQIPGSLNQGGINLGPHSSIPNPNRPPIPPPPGGGSAVKGCDNLDLLNCTNSPIDQRMNLLFNKEFTSDTTSNPWNSVYKFRCKYKNNNLKNKIKKLHNKQTIYSDFTKEYGPITCIGDNTIPAANINSQPPLRLVNKTNVLKTLDHICPSATKYDLTPIGLEIYRKRNDIDSFFTKINDFIDDKDIYNDTSTVNTILELQGYSISPSAVDTYPKTITPYRFDNNVTTNVPDPGTYIYPTKTAKQCRQMLVNSNLTKKYKGKAIDPSKQLKLNLAYWNRNTGCTLYSMIGDGDYDPNNIDPTHFDNTPFTNLLKDSDNGIKKEKCIRTGTCPVPNSTDPYPFPSDPNSCKELINCPQCTSTLINNCCDKNQPNYPNDTNTQNWVKNCTMCSTYKQCYDSYGDPMNVDGKITNPKYDQIAYEYCKNNINSCNDIIFYKFPLTSS